MPSPWVRMTALTTRKHGLEVNLFCLLKNVFQVTVRMLLRIKKIREHILYILSAMETWMLREVLEIIYAHD